MTNIHPTALVDSRAEIAASAVVGPFCVIGPEVRLDDDVELVSHVAVAGRTVIGAGTRVFPFASIGHRPQDLKYRGEPSTLEIGRNNQIREHVTMNPGTEGGGMVTRVGDNCLFMASAHVAHDCILGDNVIMANNATLAGHVLVGEFAFLGGLCAVHQFVRIGRHAMIGGMSGVEADVIPFGTVIGNRAHLNGLNIVGLKRRGFSRDDIHTLRNAYRLLFAPEGTLQERLSDVEEQFQGNAAVMEIVAFIRSDSSRSLSTPKFTGDAG
ncbi:acyl-ACP--UDP-N-acetylglucosamine O-acyltransferase [Magnetospirillum sp. SS-4]|uniref:acyl-ACP--UDP-N-acetylglucosamine O-acyltransferase n=1 Tax=Magnetospirillum sp. SS-4 TaxID=2681465 RepID=UPI00137E2E80|nr:acyl-ACP--UDP-N-acetylglucosamine O-acyltransferase [Magnetospirillum sp. SS-4]CAA7617058.1 UDP-N-acetylglucosamine acetyltransferase [Magnetospirillum sp. SS-4]